MLVVGAKSEVVIKQKVEVATVVDSLADLAICDCQEDTCLACTIWNQGNLVKCVSDVTADDQVQPQAPAAILAFSQVTSTCTVVSDAHAAVIG